jgi:hypothetical protein
MISSVERNMLANSTMLSQLNKWLMLEISSKAHGMEPSCFQMDRKLLDHLCVHGSALNSRSIKHWSKQKLTPLEPRNQHTWTCFGFFKSLSRQPQVCVISAESLPLRDIIFHVSSTPNTNHVIKSYNHAQ